MAETNSDQVVVTLSIRRSKDQANELHSYYEVRTKNRAESLQTLAIFARMNYQCAHVLFENDKEFANSQDGQALHKLVDLYDVLFEKLAKSFGLTHDIEAIRTARIGTTTGQR